MGEKCMWYKHAATYLGHRLKLSCVQSSKDMTFFFLFIFWFKGKLARTCRIVEFCSFNVVCVIPQTF